MGDKTPSLATIRVLTGVALAAALCSMPRVGLWLDSQLGLQLVFAEIFNVLSFLLLASCILYCAALLRRSHASVHRTANIFKEMLEARKVAMASQHTLETFLNVGPDAFLNTADDGTILSVNRCCIELFGASYDELVGMNIAEFIPDNIVNEVLKRPIDLTVGTGPRETRTCKARRLNKEEFYAEIATTRCIVNDTTMILYVVRDSTQSVTLQKKLRESRQNLFAILENSAEILCALDTEHRLTIWNQQFEDEFKQITGKVPHVGMVYYESLEQPAQDFWSSTIDRVLTGKSEVFVRQYMVAGEMRYMQTSVRPITIDGQIIGVSGSVVNITERVKSEKRLRRSLERYEVVTKATNEIIWDWNISKGKMYWGANYEKLFGYTLDKEETESGAWVLRVHEDDRQRIIETVQKALADPTQQYWEDEYKYLTASGATVLVHDKAYIVRNEEGVAVNMIGAMDDVTEQRNVEKRLRDFNKELENQVAERTEELHEALAKERELSELKTRFMSMVSHEFRTPLTVILSSTELLHRYNERLDVAQRDEYFRVIHHEIQRLVGMLTDVITLGRTSSGKLKVNATQADAQKFIESVVTRMYSVPSYRDRIVIENSLSNNVVTLDESLMQHALSNLLSNALKYSDQSSSVVLHIESQNDELCIHVRDKGIGVPERDVQHLFEPFHRAANVGNVPGSGLGLSIVHEFVHMHNGRVQVKSTQHQGSVFSIILPQSQTLMTTAIGLDSSKGLISSGAQDSKEHSRSYLIQHPASHNGGLP